MFADRIFPSMEEISPKKLFAANISKVTFFPSGSRYVTSRTPVKFIYASYGYGNLTNKSYLRKFNELRTIV